MLRRALIAALLACACAAEGAGGEPDGAAPADESALAPEVQANTAPCVQLFGLPNEKTGLREDQCQPRCDCEGRRFAAPEYSEADMAAIAAMVHLEPYAPLAEDPYAAAEIPAEPPGTVCAVLLDDEDPGAYRLGGFPSAEAARAAGARVSHEGGCGLCSPLVNLLVYMRHPDLTDPVRQCGLEGMVQGKDHQMACLMALGFDEPCASIWYFNTRFTQQACGGVCLALLEAPYHEPDGRLNECLQCDEDEAGPIFKAYAGRTRRNTGLPSSMCRPCPEVLDVVHDYR